MSAKGADAHRQGRNELASPSGGARDTATVLRAFLKKLSRYAASALFLAAGFLHLVRPAPFAAIVPPYIPQHFAIVFISGIAELAGGIGLLLQRTRWLAAWGLAALLVAVFPANVYMAVQHLTNLPAYVLWGRLFLQPLLIWWVLSFRPREK